MPMADIFAPDINFTPVRAVYPTAGGGTLAGAGGAMSQNTNTLYPDALSNTHEPTTLGPSAGGTDTGGKPLAYWIGFVIFLALFVWIARKAGGPEDFRNIRPTFYNFMTITLTAILGIVGLKVIFAKFHVPGASELIMAA